MHDILRDVDDCRWYFCEERTLYFRYRIFTLLFILSGLAVCLVVLPYIGILDMVLDKDNGNGCSTTTLPLKNFTCYLSGLIYTIMLIAMIIAIITIVSGCIKFRNYLSEQHTQSTVVNSI